MNRLVLIDTQNFFHRAFYAYPTALTTSEGEPINAVYGFASMLVALVDELRPTHLAVADESGKEPVFRQIEFPEYKATRIPKSPEEQAAFDSQLPKLNELLAAAGIPHLLAEGFEADDVIGTIARQATSSKLRADEVIVASNDRDLMQLIGRRVCFYLPAVGKQKAKLYSEKEFLEEYGFKPAQLVEYKALRGDSSDNIPGVQGIGEKTAAELVKKYGTVEEIYKHILEIRPTIARKLIDGKGDAKLSHKLATIMTAAPIRIDLGSLKFGGFARPEVRNLFQKWKFKSLLKKLEGSATGDRRQGEGGENQLQLKF